MNRWRNYRRDLSQRDRVVKLAAWDRWQRRERRIQRLQSVAGIAFLFLVAGCAAIATWHATIWVCDLFMRQLLGAS